MIARTTRCIQASQLLSKWTFRTVHKTSSRIPKIPTRIPEYKTPKSRPKPQDTPANSKSNRINRVRFHPIPLLLGGIAVASCAGYVAFIVAGFYRDEPKTIPIDASAQADVSSRYNSIAYSFDDTVDSNEYWLGITSLRKKLVRQALGHVLEVSIGTGRNLAFYDWDIRGYNGVGRPDARGHIKKGKVKSFTAIDASLEMLDVAHKKLETLIPGIRGVRWILGDATATGIIPSPPQISSGGSEKDTTKYDTIVQTMGLCSVKDPVALLRELGKHIKEEEGRILLLEHGRGRWKWLNSMLDKTSNDHARAFGCWWNRDIRKIVDDSGLEIVCMKTPKWWHGGTTWWIELKKGKTQS